MIRKLTALAVAGIASAGIVAALPGSAAAAPPPRVVGHVYQASNDPAGNAVHVYNRYADGTLEAAGSVATDGLGTGASLGSQGGLARAGRVVFVVNAGDDTVSALASGRRGLVLRDKVSSGGDRPVSVTVRNGVGYVLNQGDDTISGFRYDRSGDLRVLPASRRALTANPAGGPTDAAQVSFTPNGRTLVVTEKASNTIDTFEVKHGYAGKATAHPAAGRTPYGFDFDRRGNAVVSEAASGSASSYRVPSFTTITGALANTQAAACWLVVSGNVAYVVNAASASISTYAIAGDGSLSLINAVAATTEAGPTDAAVSSDGRHLYVRVRSGAVSSWRIGPGGALTAAGTSAPASAFGIAGLVAD
jgi:6-phosphogluconolactonase (cycloisomerase 2 family)